MSVKEVNEWTKYYKNGNNLKVLRKYILDKYGDTIDEALQKVRESTAETLATLMFKKDSVVGFQNQHGSLFRWQVQTKFNLPMPGMAVAPEKFDESTMLVYDKKN